MRARFESLADWVVTAAVLIGALTVGLNLSGEVRKVVPVTPLIAVGPSVPVPPPVVPSGSVSLSQLVLPGGQMVSVGQNAGDVTQALAGIRPVSESVERMPRGERVTRGYNIEGRIYYVVLDDRVTALFMRN